MVLAIPREGQTAAKEHRSSVFVSSTIFVIAHKGKSPAGKLHPDLVASAGV